MIKSMKDDPIEGFLHQGVKMDEIRDALLRTKKVKKRKNGMKPFGLKWQSPPRIIINIENHFHANVDNVIE